MGFVSLTEDIIKRHEADVHELMRSLELAEVPRAQQERALPQFEQIVTRLGEILSDPNQPFAMKLIHLRTRSSNLESELKLLLDKNDVLGRKNSELNERIAASGREIQRLRAEAANQRSVRKCLDIDKNRSDTIIADLRTEIGDKKLQIRRLEGLAMEAQVSRRI